MSPLVAVVGYEGLATFEFAMVAEIFGLPRPELGPDWYRFQACAIEPGPQAAAGGVQVMIADSLDVLRQAHTIIVPGWVDPAMSVPEVLVSALHEAHGRGARIVSICTGAFVLAAAGLLSGRRSTTHWQHTSALAALDPTTRVLSDVLYVDEGLIMTSAGSASGIDLCLHIIRSDYGADYASHVARRLVVASHREGGQAQIVGSPVLTIREGARLGPLLDQLRRRLDAAHTLESMAASVGMSERTFVRRFRAVTGTTPGEWLLSERLTRARELLETTELSVEQVTFLCGFGSVVNLRHHFRRKLATTPSAYRLSGRRKGGPAGAVQPGPSGENRPDSR